MNLELIPQPKQTDAEIDRELASKGVLVSPGSLEIRITMANPHECVCPFRSIRKVELINAVVVLERVDPQTQKLVGFYIHLFRNAELAVQFYQNLGGPDRIVGDEDCLFVAIIKPDPNEPDGLNNVEYLGYPTKKTQPFFFVFAPISSMEALCAPLKDKKIYNGLFQ